MSKISKKLKHVISIRLQRKRRVRSVVSGEAKRPRLVVQRSLRHFRAQLIDDTTGKTIASASSDGLDKLSGTEQATKVGQVLAEAGKKAGISNVVFDRRYYRYHGRVKAFADAAREGGLQF
jgi:large subunit ribosomal protein L18